MLTVQKSQRKTKLEMTEFLSISLKMSSLQQTGKRLTVREPAWSFNVLRTVFSLLQESAGLSCCDALGCKPAKFK